MLIQVKESTTSERLKAKGRGEKKLLPDDRNFNLGRMEEEHAAFGIDVY